MPRWPDGYLDRVEERIERRLAELAETYSDPTAAPTDETLQRLLAALSHPDSGVRQEAALALGDAGNPLAVHPLAEAYYDHKRRESGLSYNQPDEVRLAIGMALFQLGESRELSDILSSESGYLRRRMVEALKGVGAERAVPLLIDGLAEGAWSLSHWAVRALGELRARSALEPLIDQLEEHSGEGRVAAEHRLAVTDTLGRLGDERAIPALERARETDHAKNWMGRTVSEGAAMAIDEILRSKGIAPRYRGDNANYVSWVNTRFQHEANTFIADMKRERGVRLRYSKRSLARLDRYVEQVRDDLSPDEEEFLVTDLATFLGECIHKAYDGEWKPRDGKWAVVFGDDRAAFPFTEVRRVLEDENGSLVGAYQRISTTSS